MRGERNRCQDEGGDEDSARDERFHGAAPYQDWAGAITHPRNEFAERRPAWRKNTASGTRNINPCGARERTVELAVQRVWIGGSVPPSARIFMFWTAWVNRAVRCALSAARAASSASIELSYTRV